MKKVQKFLIIAISLIVISIFLGVYVDVKNVFVALFFSLLLIGYLIYKDKIGQELVVAFFFAITLTAYYVYEYTTPNLMIGRINLFPLVSWVFGLVLMREIYERIKGKNRFLKISVIYLVILFIVEYIGYYLLNVHLNSNFTSIFGLGIIHAPLGMKLFYILAGPAYILVTDYLKVK